MPKLDYPKLSPGGIAALQRLETYLHGCGLESSLLELVKTRVSQINGCAYCLDMHTKDARASGETEQRLYTLSAWRETPFFTDRERAALAWAEAVTLIADSHPGVEVDANTAAFFDDKELVDLTLAIVAINGWNRIAISFHAPVGSYQPPK